MTAYRVTLEQGHLIISDVSSPEEARYAALATLMEDASLLEVEPAECEPVERPDE